MRCNKFTAIRVAAVFMFGVTMVSYSGIDPTKLMAAALRLKAKLPVREMTLSVDEPKGIGSSGGSGGSSSGK